MIVRRLDKNGDWTFGSNKANYAKDSEAIKQCVKTVLLSFWKDWFLDEEHGIHWFDYFVKNPNVAKMEAELKRKILEIDGVSILKDLSLQLDTVTRVMLINVNYIDIFNTNNTVAIDVGNN